MRLFIVAIVLVISQYATAQNSVAYWEFKGNNGKITDVTKLACQDKEFNEKGYYFYIGRSWPSESVKNQSDAWYVTNGRAFTVQGCWHLVEANKITAMLRKKDGKVWEENIALNDPGFVAYDAEGKEIVNFENATNSDTKGTEPVRGTQTAPQVANKGKYALTRGFPLCDSLMSMNEYMQLNFQGDTKGMEWMLNEHTCMKVRSTLEISVLDMGYDGSGYDGIVKVRVYLTGLSDGNQSITGWTPYANIGQYSSIGEGAVGFTDRQPGAVYDLGVLKRGQKVEFNREFIVQFLFPQTAARVKQYSVLSKDGKVIYKSNDTVEDRASGSYHMSTNMPVPDNAEPGIYEIQLVVESQDRDMVRATFTVGP